jgi:hypothetical protein
MQTENNNTRAAQAGGDGKDFYTNNQGPQTQGDENDEPVLDDEDLDENKITDEEADNIEWDEPAKNTNHQ